MTQIDSKTGGLPPARHADWSNLTVDELVAHFRAILASTLDPVVTIDSDGVIHSVSDSVERVLGWTPEELIGRNVRILMPEPHRSAHDGYLTKYRTTGQTNILGRARQFDAQHKDGRTIPIELSVSRVDIPGQTQPYFTGIIHDISDRLKAEAAIQERSEALAQSNRDLEQFAYVASHDLQEPLRMMRSFAQLLVRRHGDELEGEAKEFLEYIIDGADRMKQLIEDLLAFSRVNTRARPYAPVDLNDLADRVREDLEHLIHETGAQVRRRELPTVVGDETQLGLVLQNLFSNAMKFRRDEHRPIVETSATKTTDGWEIRVTDNGVGISPRHHERVFDIFERLHGREVAGTGIGLAICKRIVERHGGRIWVESEGSEGATFHFTIPDATDGSVS
ncbi:MAG: PAS domain S-box protein [Phycisphaerales bacterium]